MSKGALIFAHNNALVDYVKLAIFAANRIVKFLQVPVSIVTDNKQWLESEYPNHPFDHVIEITREPATQKFFYDGAMFSKKLDWNNMTRYRAYDLTPYDTTLVIDSDYIINSDLLKIAFERDEILQVYRKSVDLAGWRPTEYFQRINPYSIPFYWATVFVFSKNQITKSFFDLVLYIKENWNYFKILYHVDSPSFRNDIAFSIAIHIMNGKTNGEFVTELPGSMTYIQDRDILIELNKDSMKFLVEKEKHLGEYIMAKTQGIDVHVMNKMSLSRIIDEGINV